MIDLSRGEALQLGQLVEAVRTTSKGSLTGLSLSRNYDNYRFVAVTARYPTGQPDEWVLTDNGFTKLNDEEEGAR